MINRERLHRDKPLAETLRLCLRGKGVAFGTDKMANQNFQTVGQVLKKGKAISDRDKYFSREFQAYGYYLAKELDDLQHTALYIKYAKERPRGILEEALSVVKNASKIKSKARLFMWKLRQLDEKRKK